MLKIHPTAARFPALPEEELEALAQDIKANGLHQKIVTTWDGKTLCDGINRMHACERVGVQPKIRKLPKSYSEADIIQFIIGANLRRRDLNQGQKAMLALDAAADLDKAAQERLHEALERGRKTQAKQGTGKKRKSPKSATSKRRKKPHATRDDLAKMAKVGGGTMQQARAIRDYSPILAARVLSGEISLNEAYKLMRREKAANPPEDGAPGKQTTVIVTHEGNRFDYPLPKARPHFNRTNDQVDWAAWTTNPVTGCLHNCKYCYAREGIEVNENLKKHYPFGFTPTFFEYRLAAFANSKLPENWRDDPRLGRVFVSSMGDLFGNWVPDEWIEKVFAACIAAPWWEYLYLTKFPQRYVGLDLPPTAWIGTTVDLQQRVKIAEEAFRKITNVRLKWLSCEPLLEPLHFTDLSMFDFVVIGSQSATNQPGDGKIVHVPEFAPPFEWVADLTEKAHRAGCKVYQKPNLLGVVDPQHAGMKLIQEVPDLADLPARTMQGELPLAAAE